MKNFKIICIFLAFVICAGEIMAQSKKQLKEINEFLKKETEFLKKLVDQKQEQKQLEKAICEQEEIVEATRIERLFVNNKFNNPEKLQAIGNSSAKNYMDAFKYAVGNATNTFYMSFLNFCSVASAICQKSKQVNGDNDNKDISGSLFSKLFGNSLILPTNKTKIVDSVKSYNDSTGEYSVQVLMEYQTPDENNLEASQEDSLYKAISENIMEAEVEDCELEKNDSIQIVKIGTPELVRELNERLYKMLKYSSEMKKRLDSFDKETKELTKKQLLEYNEALRWQIKHLRLQYNMPEQGYIISEQGNERVSSIERFGTLLIENMEEHPEKLMEVGIESDDDSFRSLNEAEVKAKYRLYNSIMDFARVAYAIHAKLMQKNGKKANKELLDGFFSSYIKNVVNGSKVVYFEKMYNKYNEEYTARVLVDYDIPVDSKSNEFKALNEVLRYILSW